MQTHFHNNALVSREIVFYQFYEKFRDVHNNAIKPVLHVLVSGLVLNEIHRLMSNAPIQFKG